MTWKKKTRTASETACSDANYAVKLLELFFKKEELQEPNVYVYGKQFKGVQINKML